MNHFAGYHPVVISLYFAAVLFVSMFTVHPYLLLASLAGAVLYFCTLNHPRAIWGNLAYYSLLFLLITLINPLISHNGETPLFFLNDRPVTLESLVFGGAIAVMLVAILFWCKALGAVMDTDKTLYLFGKSLPKIALLLSMSIRFVPLLRRRMRELQRTQRAMGFYTSKSLTDRLIGGVQVISTLITWALDSAVDTADSMRARGYGLKGRSTYSIYRLGLRDKLLTGALAAVFIAASVCLWLGVFDFYYFPALSDPGLAGGTRLWYAVFLLLMALPSLLQLKGELTWKYYRSTI